MLSYEIEEIISHEELLESRKLKIAGWISFFMGFAQALVIYILSSYFKQISGTENVGGFYLISYTVALLALLNLHKVVKAVGKSAMFHIALFLKIITVSFLMILPPSFKTLPFLMFYLIISVVEWVGLDIILESCSTDSMSGRIRGKHLMFINAGFLLAPLLSAFILDNFGFNGIFLLLFLINSVIFVISLVGFQKVNHAFRGEIKVREIFEKVKVRPNIRRIYYISFVLECFYALMIVFTPLYLRDLGLSWEEIGVAFTAMLVPFVVLPYVVGYIADKKLGEKEMIIFSLLLIGLTTFLVYLTSLKSVVVWALILFATRIGAALLETLRDSYFYKRVDSRDVDIINFFRTASPVGYIVASSVSSILLLFLSTKYLFILVVIVAFTGLYPAIRLVDNKSEREL